MAIGLSSWFKKTFLGYEEKQFVPEMKKANMSVMINQHLILMKLTQL